MERIFDILFTHFAQTSTYVGMYGKSGGKGKILSRYHMSDAAIVLQSWKDLHNMAVDADRFVVMQLPFTVFAGQYFTQKYGQKSFAALTLPICVKQLTDLSAEVYARNPDADVWIADARIHLKGYGYDILQGCGLI